MSEGSTCSDSTNPATSSVGGSDTSERRCLRFSKLAKVYCIPALCEYSSEEITAMWTTDADTERSQASVVDVIRYMRTGSSVDVELDLDHHDNDECVPCIRGLEHLMTQERMDRRQRHKEKVCDSVLDEQFDQEAKGLDRLDDGAISAASEKYSQSAKDAALARGTADAEYAKLHVYYDYDDEDEGVDQEQAVEGDNAIRNQQDAHDPATSDDKANDEQIQGGQFFSTLFTALDLSSEEMSKSPTTPTSPTTTCTNDKKTRNNSKPRTRRATLQLKSSQVTTTANPKCSVSTASEATDSFYEKLHSLKLRSGAKVLNKLYQDDSKKTNLRYMVAKQASSSGRKIGATSA